MLGHVSILRLNEKALKESTRQVGLIKKHIWAAVYHSSLLLTAQSHRERKKAKAAHAPQDRNGHGSHCYAQQHHTHDQTKDYFVKHG
jgi:hypothetical protein